MNYTALIEQLKAEHARVVAAIAALELITEPRKGRGRKSMPPAERLEVSARMKRYWASQRKSKGAHA